MGKTKDKPLRIRHFLRSFARKSALHLEDINFENKYMAQNITL